MGNLSYNRIVTLNVSEVVAPVPNTLQETAAVVSNGGTSLSSGATQYIAAAGSIASYLKPAYVISAISWATGVVTLVTSLPHGIPVGETTVIKITGTTPDAYNGVYTATAYDTTTLNYSLACLLYTSPSPRDYAASRMPSSA